METTHVGKITIKKLIKELQRFPPDTKIYIDDGNGWGTRYVCLVYDKDDKTLGILAREGEEEYE